MTMGSPAATRPLPALDEADTGPFWRACGEHRLTYQRTATGEVVFYPRQGAGVETHESAGLGTIYTYTVVRQHGHPFFRAHAPYVVAYVDLDEGFRILAEVDSDPDAVRIGQRVQVAWEDHDGVAVPIFRAVS
ncbi:Zn-ribbon domain-containing OB-fold protein [Pseudonocardia nigra]|uniref:Zn-ribbon domain-containing OB-fold protein n=1 Tax=Pseudonocardia nigra TaxID=1921578 RepID=UPI001C5E3A55|nr:OB-fold domain-containing protein [Pseudonocardia nigra]